MAINGQPLVLIQKEQPPSSAWMKLQIFLDAKPEKRAEHFQETVEYFIKYYTEDVQAQNIATMIDRVNMNIRNGEIKPELFIDKKRFNGKTFFQRILETKNEKLIEACREKGVDYDPQEDFKVFIKGIDKNPEYTTLDNYNIIDKIIRGFNDSDKYRKFEGFNISDYLSANDILADIIRYCPDKSIINRATIDAKTYDGTVVDNTVSRLQRMAEIQKQKAEQKRVEAEKRAKGLGLLGRVKNWLRDWLGFPELSPELKKIQEALDEYFKRLYKGQGEKFNELLKKVMSPEDINPLRVMLEKYKRKCESINRLGGNEFVSAMEQRLLELESFQEPQPQTQTQPISTPTQTSSVEPSNNTLSTATSAQNPEDTGPKVLEGEIMKPEHINVSNKNGKEYEPTTINGEYRIIDDGIARKVGDKDIKKAPYRNQELISGGKNPDKYKITTKGATQDIIRSLPEHNNKRFITSQQEVLIPEIVKVGGVKGPEGHIKPDNTETIEGGVQPPPQTEGLDVGEITTIEQAEAKGYHVYSYNNRDWEYTDSEGYKHFMRDGIELTKGIKAKWIEYWARNGDWAYTDSKGYQHLMRGVIELTKGIKTREVYSPGDGDWAYRDEKGDWYSVRNDVHTLRFKRSDQEVEQSKDKNQSRWGRISEKAKGLKDKAIDKAKGLGLNVGKIIKSIPSFTKAIPKVVGGVAKAVGEDLKDKWKKLKGLNIKDEFGKLKEKAINIKAAWDSGELQKNINKSLDKEKKRARRLGYYKYAVKMFDRYNKRDIATKYTMSVGGSLAIGGTLGLWKFASGPFIGIAKYREGYKKAYKEKMLELAKKGGLIGAIPDITESKYYINDKELSEDEISNLFLSEKQKNKLKNGKEIEFKSLKNGEKGILKIKSVFKDGTSREQRLKYIELQKKSKDRIKEAKIYADNKAFVRGAILGLIAGVAGLEGDYLRGDGPGKYLGDKVFPDRDNYFDNNPNNFINDTQIPDTSANSGIPNTTPPEGTNITGNPDTGYQTPTPADATTPVNPNPNPISQTPNPTSTPGTISTPDTAGINSFGDNYTIKAGDKLENVFEDRMSEVFGPAGRDNPERLKEIYNMFKNPEISDMLREAGVRYDNTGIPNIIKPGQEIPFAQILSKAKELGLLQE